MDEAHYFEQHRMWLHAVQVYQRLLDVYPGELKLHIRLGQVYLEMGNLKAAEQVLLHAFSDDPRNKEILYSLGVICYQSQDYDRALYYLQKLAAGTDAKAHYSLGLVHWQRGDLENAERHFKKTLELQADHLDAALALGEARLRNGKTRSAVEAFHQAVAIDPQSSASYTSLGSALLASGHWNKAMEAFERALVLDPGQPELLTLLAGAMLRGGHLDEAEHVYKDLLGKQDRVEEALMGLGRVSLMKSNRKRAAEYFARVLEINPENVEALEQVQYLAPHGRTVS